MEGGVKEEGGGCGPIERLVRGQSLGSLIGEEMGGAR